MHLEVMPFLGIYGLLLLSNCIQGFELNFFENDQEASPTNNINTSASSDFTEIPQNHGFKNETSEDRYGTSDENQTSEGTSKSASETDLYQLSSSFQYPASTQKEPETSLSSKMKASTMVSNSNFHALISPADNAINTTSGGEINQSSLQSTLNDTDEEEKVVIGMPFHTENATFLEKSKIKTIYIKAVELISDTYTLSILIPVAAGVVFASTIIVTIAACKCLRKRCLRNRLRRKVLPDSVKHLRPSDKARLLAESSDDEF